MNTKMYMMYDDSEDDDDEDNNYACIYVYIYIYIDFTLLAKWGFAPASKSVSTTPFHNSKWQARNSG